MFFFFISVIFVNLFLYYENYIFILFLFFSLLWFCKRNDVRMYFFFVALLLVFFTKNINYYEYESNTTQIMENLLVLEKYDNYSIVGTSKRKFLIYNNDYNFYVGNEIYFEGYLENIRDSYNDFYNYLNKKGVNYVLNYDYFKIIEGGKKENEIIIDKLLANKGNVSKSYLKLILFNVKNEYNEDFYSTFSVYSLTYLIAVSGFHIRLLLSFFKKLFKKNFVGICVVSFYLYLLDFSVSSYRAFLCYVIKKINKKVDFNLSNNDIISLIGSAFIIINPSIMFSFSFIYSFLATFVLEIFRLYSNKRLTFWYIYLINIPLILLNYYKINISSILFTHILTLPISFLYVFSFIFLFFDKFYLLYEIVINVFNKLLLVLDKFNLIIVLGKPSIVFVIIYYLVLISYFVFKERRKKSRIIFMLIILILLGYQYSKPLLNCREKIYFLNVGQGDCTAFFIPNSKEVVLLDTGGSRYKDIAIKEIIPFLESKGVNKIRKVVLTHDDYDHIGALESLKDNFNVGEIVDSSLIDYVKIGKSTFINLNLSESRDNDGSIVLYGKYAGMNLLLMGDASKEIENKILDKVGSVDVIKIGHHGSNTSSGFEFLSSVGAKIAIISVGKKNIYGHPDEEVIKNLNKLGYVIFRTDENNDIGFEKDIFGFSFMDYFE